MKKTVLYRTLLLCFVGQSFVQCTTKNDQAMNVVFFLVDDLGWSDVGCYGSTFYETPNIDDFAEEGLRFTDAYAACHVCSPTRASILTGKYPASINLTDWLPGRNDFPFQKLKNVEINQHLPYELITLPEVLKENGYSTAIIGKWHLGDERASATLHGFDLQLPLWNKGWPNKGYYFPYEMEGLEEGKEGEYLTDRLTEEALKYIENNKDNPFFLYLSHFAVHDPIQGRKDLVEKYAGKSEKMSYSGEPFILEGNPDDEDVPTREELNELIQKPDYQGYKIFEDGTVKIKQHQDNIEFAAMVESMDESFGRILGKLKDLGLDNNTLVVFYSDNGGMSAANFYNPDRRIGARNLDKAFATSNLLLRGAKGWMYEGGIRVPLIIKNPESTLSNTICDVPVSSPDFYPTILDILDIDVPVNVDGVSLKPLLEGEKQIAREAIYWHFPHYSNHGMQSPGGAIRMGDYKLLEYFENGTIQLFNLKEDIGEQHDLSGIEKEKAEELLDNLHQWQNRIGAHMMPVNPNYDPIAKYE